MTTGLQRSCETDVAAPLAQILRPTRKGEQGKLCLGKIFQGKFSGSSTEPAGSTPRARNQCGHVWSDGLTVQSPFFRAQKVARADIRISWSITTSSSTNAYLAQRLALAAALARLDIHDRQLLAIVRALS